MDAAKRVRGPAGAGAAVQRVAEIMARLRGPDGCPWDREQTFDTIKRHTLEETYEVFDAIERRSWPELKDELGDLLLQVLFYAQMASEAGHFDLGDVAETLEAKLVRRHPHVFGEAVAEDSEAVLRRWEEIKAGERRGVSKGASLLDEVPRSMPATMEAGRLGAKAAKAGFDWPGADGLFDKVAEEVAELRSEIAREDAGAAEDEFGDLLFTMMNLARHLGVDAESALRRSSGKFRRRFAGMEAASGGAARMRGMRSEELEELWTGAKRAEGRD